VLYQDFKIQNIVGSCDAKFPIRLEGLAYSHGAFSSVCGMIKCSFSIVVDSDPLWIQFFIDNTLHFVSQYEPELFPGLIYRMKQPKIVLLIFVSGKIVLTGAKVRSTFILCAYYYAIYFFLFGSFLTPLLPGERGDVHCLRKHLSCTDGVQESSAMVCLLFFL
jgi:hypothetical protein